ncbi:MAG TPA: GAF domain-containing protein, partial [Candidatus Acidoferrum sp.]|nr:GAF domain-containing protein [Candidatus Acidoferrum sp.]
MSERHRAEEHLQQELRVNAALATLYGPLISPQSSLDSVARLVLDQALRLTESAHGFVATIDPVTKALLSHTLTGMMEGQCQVSETARGTALPRGADGMYPALWGHSLNTRKAFYTTAPQAHAAAHGTPAGHVPLERFLTVPVLLGGELVGQIALANAPTAYTEAHLAPIERLAEIFALAIHRTRAEAALRESQAWLQSIFRSAPIGIGLVKDRVLSWANDTLCRMVGYTAEELLGQSARILYPTAQEFDRVGQDKYAQIRAHGQGTVETRWQRKDGEVRDILLSSSPLDRADWSVGVTFTALDITERKRTEAALRTRTAQLETLRRVSQEIVREMDLGRLLGLITGHAAELLHAPDAGLLLWHPDTQRLVPEHWLTEQSMPAEFTVRLGEGITGLVAQDRQGRIVNDYRTWTGAHPEMLRHTRTEAVLAEPLLYHDTLLGVLLVADS